MITIECLNSSKGVIKITNDKTYQDIKVYFDSIDDQNEMVLKLLTNLCSEE